MLRKYNYLPTLIILIIFFNFCTDKSGSTGPKSDTPRDIYDEYFNQVPPGDVPELFAENIVSTDSQEFGITFTPDGKECFFTRNTGWATILTSKENDGTWPNPQTAEFSGSYVDIEPLLNPTGTIMLFGSRRPVPAAEVEIDIYQWTVRKDGDVWNEPIPPEPPFRDIFVMYPTMTDDGSIYFTGGTIENGTSSSYKICYSKFNDQNYEPVEVLSDSINRFDDNAHPYIAPDESFLIYDARSNPYGNSDLYISYRNENGDWTRSVKLNEDISTSENEICPFVTVDGKYLFFTRVGDIYWVNASFIDDMRP